ncbi:hypothetical protein Moror_17386 [Moniliophthora roreri MCA 2997]|uniref:Uncharacterized protein n=2 Tax=Moniliophthora roreri TaxID=221103 RepID=V2Z155_MONRO|nr:hypothetical protein Moror_17386 [Moniliophthora roreri MCA 2997]
MIWTVAHLKKRDNFSTSEMKLAFASSVLAALTGIVSAYRLVSPVEGQVLSKSKVLSFFLPFLSIYLHIPILGKYESSFFKENTVSVNVVLAPADTLGPLATVPFQWGVELATLSPSNTTYKAQLKPYATQDWPQTGKSVLAVVERHTAGCPNEHYNGWLLTTINVTLSD